MTRAGRVEEHDSPKNWTELSLHAGGRSLIEASAGTGKTWAISVLYLRLLLEQEFNPKQVVVTTFTDAAAQELRERIRERLSWAEQLATRALAADADASPPKPDGQWLQGRWRDVDDEAFDPVRINADLNRLRLASAELDLAPIGTLHSLCRKVLTDYPFESGSTFDLGDMVSTNSLMQECARDLWRRLQQGEQSPAGDDHSAYAPERLQDLHTRLKAYLSPGVTLQVPDEKSLQTSLTEECAARIEAFASNTDMYALTEKGNRKKTLSNALSSLVAWIRDPKQTVSDAHRKTLTKLQAEFKPEYWEQLHAGPQVGLLKQVLSTWDQLASVAEARIWKKWIETARASNQKRLATAGQLTFDELIERVYRALPKGGSVLADRLFDAWPVAMVDEFQDTDAQQYAILDRIYRGADGADRGRLVMIGDPKQAIYRFRGGDIDAYLEARKSATSTLTLDTNFRSSRPLVAAFNAFYARAGETLSSNAAHEIA
ncbi:MAG: UvrD-helicase domain-containing protein, partial [Dokdonella sp.]